MAQEIQFLLYNMPEEEGRVQVVIKDETIWCTQKAMAELFGIDKSGVSRHIAKIYSDGELSPDTTVAKIATVVNNENNRKFSAFPASENNLESFKIERFRACENVVKVLRKVSYFPHSRDRNGTKMAENGRFLAI